ncbi:MAG TPA: ATP-binding protein [Polyangia bacterium]|jgi:signal transduction histidine kinase/ActR/RegA family two-component response regulator
MARILLVDNEAGDRRAAARALGVREQELEAVESIAAALVRAAEAGHGFVLVTPAQLEASLGSRPSSSADLLRETFDVFEDGVCLLARNGELKVANAIGERLFESALKGELQGVASEASRRGATADRCLTLEGRAFAARAYPLSERGVVLYIRDATDEREREIGRLQSEKLASIGMLAAGVAHEINNPAAFVLANIEALTGHMRLIEDKLRDLPEAGPARAAMSSLLFEAGAILQESKEGMARIQRIVKDLGSFSHADDDINVPISVNVAVESALTMLRNELKYRARVEQDLRAKRLVLASAARLGQVFLNLISNAVQALEEADVKRNLVRVRSFDDGGHVVVEVSDNGPGISAEAAPRIFESFFTTKPRGMGTGLGLPISLGIVRSLGGEIIVDSRPGEGATFRVRIPATEGAPASRSAISEITPARVFSRRRILAIDDEALLLKAYRRMLGEAHEVVTALGGPEAIQLLEKDARFDVVMCDLQMPEMSGMELHAVVVKRYPALADRFVFVTGGAFSGDARRFLEESVPAVIGKPFNVDEMLTLVDSIASGRGKRAGRPASPRPPSPPLR